MTYLPRALLRSRQLGLRRLNTLCPCSDRLLPLLGLPCRAVAEQPVRQRLTVIDLYKPKQMTHLLGHGQRHIQMQNTP